MMNMAGTTLAPCSRALRRNIAMEEKLARPEHIVELPFDVMLAAVWTLGGGVRLPQSECATIGARALHMFPDNSIRAMTDLVLTVEEILAGPDSESVVGAFLINGRRAGKRIPWLTIVSFIRLAAQVRELGLEERARASVIVKAWGLNPAAFGIGEL